MRVGTHVELLAASSSYCRQLNVIVDEDSETNEPPPESVDNSSLLKLERDDHEPSQAVASLTNNVEVKQTGAVRWQVYVEFVRAGIGLLLGLAVFSLTYCMREGVFVYHNWWLAKWTDDENYRYQVSTDCTNITNAQAIAIKLMNEVEWKDHRDQRFFTYASKLTRESGFRCRTRCGFSFGLCTVRSHTMSRNCYSIHLLECQSGASQQVGDLDDVVRGLRCEQ